MLDLSLLWCHHLSDLILKLRRCHRRLQHASFGLSKCGTGLIVQSPKVEDIEFFAWRQQQNQGGHNQNGVPPPYHCKSITAIMSIVTAMLYTGASIQGSEVNCTSAKMEFANLSPDERRREFPSRLADALAALIFIAGRASLKRKKRSMKKLNREFEVKAKMMKRRLHLIPTCTWEDDPSSGMPRQPNSPFYRYIQLQMSLTNLDDIRLFVLSNIKSFTSPGGVALLLGTYEIAGSISVKCKMEQPDRLILTLRPPPHTHTHTHTHTQT